MGPVPVDRGGEGVLERAAETPAELGDLVDVDSQDFVSLNCRFGKTGLITEGFSYLAAQGFCHSSHLDIRDAVAEQIGIPAEYASSRHSLRWPMITLQSPTQVSSQEGALFSPRFETRRPLKEQHQALGFHQVHRWLADGPSSKASIGES